MEEIIKDLEKIVQESIKRCKENKTIPSDQTLDIVKLIISYRSFQKNV